MSLKNVDHPAHNDDLELWQQVSSWLCQTCQGFL